MDETTTWQIADQDFNIPDVGPGRIVVNLSDGQVLSIISAERTAYIQQEMRRSPLAGITDEKATPAQAGPGTYEVAVIAQAGEFVGGRMNDEPTAWNPYGERVNGRIVYCDVPASVIDGLVAERGLA